MKISCGSFSAALLHVTKKKKKRKKKEKKNKKKRETVSTRERWKYVDISYLAVQMFSTRKANRAKHLAETGVLA